MEIKIKLNKEMHRSKMISFDFYSWNSIYNIIVVYESTYPL